MLALAKTDRRPIITIAFGRQRVGKTVVLNAAAQYYRERGCPVHVWNADQQNQSHSLSTFFSDAQTVPFGGLEDGKLWIEQRFEEVLSKGCDAILDVGGGATSFSRLVKEVPLLEATANSGIQVVGLFCTGPERADLDYLEQFAAVGSLPSSTAIVMNKALILSDRSAASAYEPVLQHSAVQSVIEGGGAAVLFPALGCMSKVSDLGLGFREAMNGGTKKGQPSLSMFDRMRVNHWWSKLIPEFFAQLPQEWLPIEVRHTSTPEPAPVATAAE